MPRRSISYLESVIYKIVCNDLCVKDFYIGHTTNLKARIKSHKRDSNNIKTRHQHLYQTILNNGGWENWNFIIIEKCNCNNLNELITREKYWYEILQPTLNKITPKFISFDNSTTENIIGINSIETNKLKSCYRNKKEKEELIFLRIENKNLKEEIDNLNKIIKSHMLL